MENYHELAIKNDGYYEKSRSEMLAFIPVGTKTALDLGCGNGNFGKNLKLKFGCEVWGIEYQPEKAKVAATVLDHVTCGDAHELVKELPDNYFDVIICNDVLEHLIDPYSVLHILRKKLKDNGSLVSSLPNVRYFRNFFDLIFRKEWEYAEQGVMDFTHFRWFTTKSIQKMYQKLGYTVVNHVGINKTKSIKPWPMILLSLGHLYDTLFLQFATVVKKATHQSNFMR